MLTIQEHSKRSNNDIPKNIVQLCIVLQLYPNLTPLEYKLLVDLRLQEIFAFEKNNNINIFRENCGTF